MWSWITEVNGVNIDDSEVASYKGSNIASVAFAIRAYDVAARSVYILHY
ncbi:hypothetical protein SAMN05660642_03043 [Geodermatophilus siccatus]|uniref:Uncharacterized protein n=1 Tax=Geodermatophilus siccatus TaxID=1137991 RepID=A0A1G9V1U0_9ACTN|nr:hypothetical protein SAMN05660642_03043 [Geodermatophilus siccatus]